MRAKSNVEAPSNLQGRLAQLLPSQAVSAILQRLGLTGLAVIMGRAGLALSITTSLSIYVASSRGPLLVFVAATEMRCRSKADLGCWRPVTGNVGKAGHPAEGFGQRCSNTGQIDRPRPDSMDSSLRLHSPTSARVFKGGWSLMQPPETATW